MKIIISTLFFVFIANICWTQSSKCSCEGDLDYLLEELKNAPSYKEQIKGAKKASFYQYVEQIKGEIKKEEKIDLHCQVYLQKVIKQIRDEHLYLTPVIKRVKTDEEVKNFQASSVYQMTPIYEENLQDLEKKTSEYPTSDIEGIYYTTNKLLKIAVVLNDKKEYQGIVLESKTSLWKPGQVKFIIWSKENSVIAIEYDWYHNGHYRSGKNVTYLLQSLQYVKNPDRVPVFRKRNTASFNEYKKLDGQTAYLYIGSFKGSTKNLRELDSLYLAIQSSVQEVKTLIIDVRDNTGGGLRANYKLLDILDANLGKQNLHLIVNRFTGSASEHFTLELKSRGATIYGENTRGAINYRYRNRASNKPSPVTPCYQYRIGLTVAKNPKEFKNLENEQNGIDPDITLSYDEDWLTQVLRKIE